MGRRKQRRALILIGFMGSGKTSAGLRLSYCLKQVIEDTDKLIEDRQGETISEIFASKGEEYFRSLETSLLQELVERKFHQILSVGGGTPLREENRKLLHQIGTVVWLRIQPQTVYERLKEDHTRPLLQGENPLLRITELIEERQEAYKAAADVIVDVDGMEVEEVTEKILDAWNHYKKHSRKKETYETIGN